MIFDFVYDLDHCFRGGLVFAFFLIFFILVMSQHDIRHKRKPEKPK